MNFIKILSINVLVLFFNIILNLHCYANDSSIYESSGNIQFTKNNHIAMHSELLTIKLTEGYFDFQVDYILENLSDSKENVSIGFPTPKCSFKGYIWDISGQSAELNCIQGPENMSTQVDGKLVPLNKTSNYLISRNSTVLNDLSIQNDFHVHMKRPDEVNFPKEFGKITPGTVAIEERLCKKLKGNYSQKDYWCSKFDEVDVQDVYQWQYTFPPHKIVHVTHKFKLKGSYNLSAIDESKEKKSDIFCLKEEPIRTLHQKYVKLAPSRDGWETETFTKYILTTGANWNGPIEDFTLIIKKEIPNEYLSTCFTNLKKLNALEFKANIKNFYPKEDLNLLFFNLMH